MITHPPSHPLTYTHSHAHQQTPNDQQKTAYSPMQHPIPGQITETDTFLILLQCNIKVFIQTGTLCV